MTGIILAGGKSSRMGFNKAFIEVPVHLYAGTVNNKHENNTTIIERTVRLFNEIFDEIIIVTNSPLEYEQFDVRITADLIKGAGSLGGIWTGIFHASSEHIFAAACDMPFLDKDTILKMLNMKDEADAIVPFVNNQFHPLHAVYSKNCLKVVEKAIKENDLRINNLLNKIHIKKVEDIFTSEPACLSVYNVNTKHELERITSLHCNPSA
ncbi:MAG: molybdenum cofactor guanylyltransferase [Deltaproteobacteria bacterium]|nr:molybdenum cofactor guanylyltransferase [Deltaproteobacteria bacterium]